MASCTWARTSFDISLASLSSSFCSLNDSGRAFPVLSTVPLEIWVLIRLSRSRRMFMICTSSRTNCATFSESRCPAVSMTFPVRASSKSASHR